VSEAERVYLEKRRGQMDDLRSNNVFVTVLKEQQIKQNIDDKTLSSCLRAYKTIFVSEGGVNA
jgi:hypothetical protein